MADIAADIPARAMPDPITYTLPARAAEAIVDRVGRRIVLAIPVGIGKPNLLVNALYAMALADRSITLRILTGLSLVRPVYKSDTERRFVAPLLDRQFGSWPDLAYVEAIRNGTLPSNVEVHEFFLQAGQWLSNSGMQQSYASLSYAHVAAHLEREGVNVLAQLMATRSGGARDRLSLSSNPDIALDLKPYIERRRRSGAPIVTVGEINDNLPYMTGAADIPASDLDLLLDPVRPHFELFAPPKEPVSLADYAMALHTATLIKDGGTLQIGIGSFADALCHALVLRHTRNAEFRALVARLGKKLPEGAELASFDQGLYGCSEMLVDGFLALKRAGLLKRRVETSHGLAVVHAGFFLGSRQFYDELRAMPEDELAEIAMTAISFTNTLSGDTATKVTQRRDARFVNTALVLTLLGAASSDALDDGRVISGIGGQCDFVVQAHALPGARSVIAARATRGAAGGKVTSNIVWRYANVSIPRQLRDIYVTEYGVADVRGRSDREVAAAMLAIADSRFQAELQREASGAGKIGAAFRLEGSAANNTPGAITAALGPARHDGLLPVFPLGTEMTETEQALIPALGALKSASPLGIAQLLWRGARADGSDAATDAALKRMALDAPQNLKERAVAALLKGAMKPRR
jgi:acyl-CoA hydrolase